MMNNHQALSRINGREAFVMPDTADVFVSNLTQFARTAPEKASTVETAARESLEFCYSIEPRGPEERKPFVYQDGMAIIPIHGALLNRFGGSWGFVTGYQAIRRQMNAALEDDDVKVIVFDVDSPGGETAGCLELADEIRASREIKPSISVVDSLAASAGYALGSAATRMIATPSSKIGSIGVYMMHVDFSGALDQAGIQITYVEAPKGGMKTAGSPYRKLDRKTEQYLQAFVDASYEAFVSLIVENRSMDDEEIRETEARVFRAEEALALNLIDEVKTPSEAVSSFLAELADDNSGEEEDDMNDKSKATAPEATSAAPATPAAPAAAPALDQSAISAAIAEDRQRMAAIKALPEAAKRPKLADKMAVDGFTVEQAKSLLSAAAEETAEAPAPKGDENSNAVDTTNHLDAAMNGTQQPNVGSGAEQSGQGQPPSDETLAASILKDQAALVGRNFGEKQPVA